MYEILFYVGATLTVAFFILTVVLFFKNNIPSVIHYFVRIERKRTTKVTEPATATNHVIEHNTGENTEILKTYSNTVPDNEKTEILNMIDLDYNASNESTEILDEIFSYSNINNDKTEILEENKL